MKRYLIFLSALLGLSVGCHAASPSFGSFNQTYFTTNNLFISIRTNWISTNSITTLIVTNLYVTNLYSTNIIVNGTNVATFGDLLWTNDTAIHPDGVIKIKPDIGYSYISPSNTYTRGWFGNQPLFVGLQIGTNFFDNLTNSSWRVLSATNDASQVILQLGQGVMTGQDLWIMSITNTPWNGRFTLPADSVVPGFGVVKLNNNQDWVGANGSVMLLKWSNPNWWEVGRWTAGSTNQPQSVVINPTDNYFPVRQSAGVFADSPLNIPSAGSTNVIADGALYVGPNSFGFWGASDYSIVSVHDVDQSEPNNNGFAIWTISGALNGAIDGTVTTNAALLSVGVANGTFGSSVVWTGVQTNMFLDGQFGTNNPSVFRLHPTVEDISANAAYTFDTPTWQLKTAADLARFKNAGTNMLSIGHTGQIIFGPGTTNVLYRSGTDLVYTNGYSSGVTFQVRDGSGRNAGFGTDSGGNALVTAGTGLSVKFAPDNGSTTYFASPTAFYPNNTNVNLGFFGEALRWGDFLQAGKHYHYGTLSGTGLTNYARLTVYHSNAEGIYDSQAGGTGSFAPHAFKVGATNVAKFDTSSAAGETRFWLYDEDNGTMERVTVGAADSGGVGFKLLRIPN